MATIAERLGELQRQNDTKPGAKQTLVDYVEKLACAFEDPEITDPGNGTPLQNRLENILLSTSDGRNGGVTHFSGFLYGWDDTGFRSEFQDPWGSASNNQSGHFLTGVHFGYDPDRIYAFCMSKNATITTFEQVKGLPPAESICCRLIVGHEQVADDAIGASERQMKSPSDDEVRKFYLATKMFSNEFVFNISKARARLNEISIGNGVGNSLQDLMLSLFGYIFGRLIRSGDLDQLLEGGRWIRQNLHA